MEFGVSSVSSINVDMDNTAYIICKSSNTFPTFAYYNNHFINNLLPSIGYNDVLNNDSEGVGVSGQWVRVRALKSKLKSLDLQGAKEFIENLILKYPTLTSQFIPLPHDQQIKLRTFANKTNISFGCEIEGTIKAQVPKSLGATVNTHTEQINNLNKELDRVKKLEDSTVSTVTTESDFTTVEATSNGYFEDVKLEGKTLVNLSTYNNIGETDKIIYAITINKNLVSNATFTVINYSTPTFYIEIKPIAGGAGIKRYSTTNGVLLVDNVAQENYIANICVNKSGGYSLSDGDKLLKSIILEGDHTQNPPSYFEGLKSVGQSATTSEDGVDEIVVSSVNENLFDKNNCTYDINGGGYYISNYININDKIYYDIYKNLNAAKFVYYEFLDKDKKRIYMNYNVSYSQSGFIKNTYGAKYIRLHMRHNTNITKEEIDNNYGVIISSSPIKNINTPHQSDKKRLLYYNNETQAWEKPILRQWDSIEKHSDGKYYYHVRSIEEDYVEGDESVSNYITDMTTTVKPLSQEKVYECTNIDLITYANETNYIVECGAIVPRSTLKVHNNISNVVSLLQKKVSLLESNVKASQEVQDMMILETDMRMLDIELALMEFAPMKLNLGGSDMLRSATYFNFLKNHIINETYEKEYLENVMNKYLATGRINQDEYDELYKMLYPPVYDIELPIEY